MPSIGSVAGTIPFDSKPRDLTSYPRYVMYRITAVTIHIMTIATASMGSMSAIRPSDMIILALDEKKLKGKVRVAPRLSVQAGASAVNILILKLSIIRWLSSMDFTQVSCQSCHTPSIR